MTFDSKTTRRTVVKTGGLGIAAAAMPAMSYARIIGANERPNVAVMGTRSRGKALLQSFALAGGNITHVCDVDAEVMDATRGWMTEAGLPTAKTDKDLRRVLEDPSIDILVVATPDHWHAPASIMGLAAGKHIYVEKPCSYDPREGELLVAAQKKAGRVVQMGNQQRSGPETIEAIGRLHEGALGDLYGAETWYANDRKSIGNGQAVPVPDRLDWDLWQGPAPRRAYLDNIVHYDWHWRWHWGTGETCNNAAHELDLARWALRLGHPVNVTSHGERRYYAQDDWEMYDTLDLRLTYEDGRSITWDGHSCNRVARQGRGRGVLIYGEKGHAIIDRSGYEFFDLEGSIIAERKVERGSVRTGDLRGGGPLTTGHVANFIAAIKGTQKQNSPIGEGAASTLMCHLGNIAYRTDEVLRVDPETGQAKNRAAKKLWAREYENGWEPKV